MTELMKIQEVSSTLGVTKKDVATLVAGGKLQAVKIGERILITRRSLAAFLHIDAGDFSGTSHVEKNPSEELSSPLTNNDKVNSDKEAVDTMVYKGSVSKLADGRYMVQVDMGKVDGKRKRYSKGFKEEADAEEHLRKKLNELNGANALPRSPVPSMPALSPNIEHTSLTFEQYVLRYLQNGGSGRASSLCLENYRRSLSIVTPYIGKIKMVALTKEDLTKAFSKISYGYADGTIQKSFTTTRMILQKAFDDGDIPTDPTRKWQRPKSRKPKKSKRAEFAVFSDEDLQTIYEKSRDFNIELYTQFVLLACTGMRPEEMRALEWSSFNPEEKTIDIHQAVVHVFDEVKEIGKQPKSHEEISVTKSEYSVRILTLSDLAVQALSDWKKILKKDKNRAKAKSLFIFPNKEGSFKTSGGCESVVKRFRKKYGLEYLGIHFYKFRHTMCTNLILANQPIPVIQRIMGDNTTDVIMKIYTHVTGEKALRAAQGFYDDMNAKNSQFASSQSPSP